MSQSLHSKKLVKQKQVTGSTQQFLDIDQIKDGVVILKNGALRAVLMVSSINFDLKSADEQDAIITHYQSFLNSLDFPIQIFISSRKINLKHYVDTLKKLSREQTNELLHLQMEDYIQYISNMAATINIVNKSFYIVVPFSPVENQKGKLKDRLFEILSPNKALKKKGAESLEVYKDQLWQLVDLVQNGLTGTGLRLAILNTQELIELYYSTYNPGPIERLELAPIEGMALNTSLYA